MTRRFLWLWTIHPNFFIVFLCAAFCNLIAGLGYWIGSDEWHSSVSFETVNRVLPWSNHVDFDVAGIVLVCVVIAMVVGLISGHFFIARWGLSLGASVAFFFAVGQAMAALNGNLRGAAAPVLWTFFAVCQLAQAGEPVRPATRHASL